MNKNRIMNLNNIYITILICLAINCNSIYAQSVGINATGTAPDASALLDVNASPNNNKGLLLPRLSTTERNTIVSPAQSLLIYNTTDSCYQGYIGTQWVSFGCVGSTPPPSSSFICGTSTVTFTYKGVSVTYGTVSSNTVPSRCWLDRNLGATQVATSLTDVAAYGDLFQWGRLDDNHQNRTSATTTTVSTTDVPGNGNFILAGAFPWDWRSPQNTNLWQGVTGINNPCPSGFRIPTEAELNAERLSWVTNNDAGAFASPLKFTIGGFRTLSGSVGTEGINGDYYSSTFTGSSARLLGFNSGGAAMNNAPGNVDGASIRCIKD